MKMDTASSEQLDAEVRALCGAYGELLDKLTAAARDMEGGDRLAAAARAVEAVAHFVQGNKTAFAAGAHLPLIALVKALHDLRRGSQPALFAAKPTVENRPAETVSALVRGQCAAAMMILEDAGLAAGRAAAFIANELAHHRIVQPDGKRAGEAIGASLVRRWRDDVKQGKASRLVVQAAHAVIDAEARLQDGEGLGEPEMPAKIERAEMRAKVLAASLAVWFAPSR